MAKVTIHDVAKLSGVHRSTVSRVLTGSGPASQESREKVMMAVRQLNYHPDALAGALKSKRRTTWGMLSSWTCTPNSNDYFYSKTLGGMLDAAARVSYRLMLYNFQGRVDESDDCLRFCHDSHLGGLIILAPRTLPAFYMELKRLDVPTLLLCDTPADPDLNFVDLDNRAGGRLVTEHLIGLGHKKIAFIGGEKELVSNARDRYQGYLDAMKEAKLDIDPAWLHHAFFSFEHGQEATAKLLGLPAAQRPSAIFGATDKIAQGAIAQAMAQGLKIPQDLSVVGFDDNPEVTPGQPGLTTVAVPFYEMGLKAGEVLNQLNQRGEDEKSPSRIFFPPKLIIRESTAKL